VSPVKYELGFHIPENGIIRKKTKVYSYGNTPISKCHRDPLSNVGDECRDQQTEAYDPSFVG
jgi:hypothetical protein